MLKLLLVLLLTTGTYTIVRLIELLILMFRENTYDSEEDSEGGEPRIWRGGPR